MAVKLTKPEMINQQVGWCGGCGHGIIQRLIAECCEELGIVEKTVQVVDIACAYWSIDTLNCDGIAGPHGRCSSLAACFMKLFRNSNIQLLHSPSLNPRPCCSGFICACRRRMFLCNRTFGDVLCGAEKRAHHHDCGEQRDLWHDRRADVPCYHPGGG